MQPALCLAAACVSGAVAIAGMAGRLPRAQLSLPARDGSQPETVRLGRSTGFDTRGAAGRRWCVTTVAEGRVCAGTGSAESGREALARVLRARGFRVSD